MRARLRILHELTHAFAEATNHLEELHQTIAVRVSTLVKDGCSLWLLSQDGHELALVALHASSRELVKASTAVLATKPLRIAENPAFAQVLSTGEPLLFSQLDRDAQNAGFADEYKRVAAAFGIHSRCTVALRLRGRPIGILHLVRFRADTPSFDDRDLEFAQIAADSAALAIANARSYAAERNARLAAEAGERTLLDYQSRLQRMAFDAAVAEERERHRLAVVLHDGIGQDLTLVQLKLASLRSELSGRCLSTVDEALALLTKSARERSTLTFELSPPVLYDLGLGAALSWLVEDLEARCGLRVALSVEPVEARLKDAVAAILFRVTRELLMNVFKHARVDVARVELLRSGSRLVVIVADEGIGFEPADVGLAASEHGFGLFSIKEQISRLGGVFELSATVGRGTTARVVIPLSAETSGAKNRQGEPA